MELPVPLRGLPKELPGKLIPPPSLLCKPCGELSYLDLIADYAETAFAHRDAPWLFCDAFPSQTSLRAALMGARQARKPIAATVLVDASGEMPSGANPLCALLMARALGASAFGLRFPADGLDSAAQLFRDMAEHTDIPLIAQPETALASDQLHVLASSGAKLFCPSADTNMQIETDSMPLTKTTPRESDGSLLVCNESDVFYLDEYFELSELVECGLDMSDDLLQAECEGKDAVWVHITSPEDALLFAEDQHMLRLPVAFRAETEEALELALIYYNGCAIVDSRSEAAEERLAELAAGYGAVLR